MGDDQEPMTKWIDARPPFRFALTEGGALTVEWAYPVAPGIDPLRMGVVVPPEEVKNLVRGLQQSQTIRETLTARPPSQGAH